MITDHRTFRVPGQDPNKFADIPHRFRKSVKPPMGLTTGAAS